MSSKTNHRKRSHRSECVNRKAAGVFQSKRLYGQAIRKKPKQESIFSRIKNKIFNKKGEN